MNRTLHVINMVIRLQFGCQGMELKNNYLLLDGVSLGIHRFFLQLYCSINILILYYICNLVCPKDGRFPTIYSNITVHPFYLLSFFYILFVFIARILNIPDWTSCLFFFFLSEHLRQGFIQFLKLSINI